MLYRYVVCVRVRVECVWSACDFGFLYPNHFFYASCFPTGLPIHVWHQVKVKVKVKVKVSSYIAQYPILRDCLKCFTLYFPGRPVQSDTISTSLGSTHPYATINVRRLLVHISTTVYSQVLIYTGR